MKISDVFKKSSLPKHEVEFIFAELLKVPRYKLYQLQIDQNLYHNFLAIEQKRKQGIPLQYLLGVAYFYGLRLKVVPGVFIPRPETEVLVDCAIRYIEDGMSVLDVGCGSGAISLAIASNKSCQVDGLDISSLAIMVARENKMDLLQNGLLKGKVRFILGDFIEVADSHLRANNYDVIISNPPYLDFAEFDKLDDDVKKEPPIALFAGEGGMFFYRKIFEIAKRMLVKGGRCFIELPGVEDKKDSLIYMAKTLGYKQVELCYDLNNRPRVLAVEI